jgi:hypothetical protein
MSFTVTKRIRPDISVSGRPADIRVKQYDGGTRELLATLTDGGRPVPVPADCAAVLYARGPDGTETAVSCSVEPDGQVRVPIPSGITALAGRVKCELRITDGDGHTVCSLTFCVTVEAGINPDIAAADTEALGVLSSLIASCRELEKELKDIQASATGLTDEQVTLFEKVLNGLVYADTDSPTAADSLIASLKGEDSGGGDSTVAIAGVSVSPTVFALNVAQQYVLSTLVLPADYTEEITSAAWSSDDESVATVSAAGQVTALKAGTAHITYTITCTSGTFSNFTTVTVHEIEVLPDSITVTLDVIGGTPNSSYETYEIEDGIVDYQFTVDDTFETGGTFFVYKSRFGFYETVVTLSEGTDYSIDYVDGAYNVQILNCEKDDYVTIGYSSPSQSTVTTSTATGLVDLTGEAGYGSKNLIVTQTQSLTTEPNQIEITYTSSNTQANNIMLKYCLLTKTDSTWSVTKYRRFNSSADVVPTASDVTVTLDGTKVTKVRVDSIDGSTIKFGSNETDGTNGSATGTPTYTVTVSYV